MSNRPALLPPPRAACGPDERAVIRAQAARTRAVSQALLAATARAQALSRASRLATAERRGWLHTWGPAPEAYVSLAMAVAEAEGVLAQVLESPEANREPSTAWLARVVDRHTAGATARELRAVARLMAGGARLRPPLLA